MGGLSDLYLQVLPLGALLSWLKRPPIPSPHPWGLRLLPETEVGVGMGGHVVHPLPA